MLVPGRLGSLWLNHQFAFVKIEIFKGNPLVADYSPSIVFFCLIVFLDYSPTIVFLAYSL